ncbi:hypothetical protein KW805_04500 [Candidatus Pacearchaeota archaeon]|nr:hypothetical protein [Candidatus Pacearchaeota archaeon]
MITKESRDQQAGSNLEGSLKVIRDLIAKRAYEISISGTGGSELENWLRAERSLNDNVGVLNYYEPFQHEMRRKLELKGYQLKFSTELHCDIETNDGRCIGDLDFEYEHSAHSNGKDWDLWLNGEEHRESLLPVIESLARQNKATMSVTYLYELPLGDGRTGIRHAHMEITDTAK